MRVLLDECLPRKLKRHLPDHEVFTVPEMGWAGVKNGALLRLIESAQPQFAVFLTIDGNLQYQQNLRVKKLAFVVLAVPDNTIETREPLMLQVNALLQTIVAGGLVRVEA